MHPAVDRPDTRKSGQATRPFRFPKNGRVTLPFRFLMFGLATLPIKLLVLGLASLTIGACSGPFVLLPGGTLDGEAQPVPADWSFAGDYGTMQLETRPDEPYSVNIAYTFVDGVFYINAGDTETAWVKNIASNDEVRARLDGTLYEMRAVRVNDEAEIARFGRAWTDQSMFRRDPTGLEQVWVYRLVAR